ncbi:hypothetical protein [Schlesneria paludicola]|uniref:hypothetical protein n=1 Tax=Schlesneria paludicola TaxID=360056 RepID=UPI00029A321C|nr:hypothetical protein [Schlesneria paludicola]
MATRELSAMEPWQLRRVVVWIRSFRVRIALAMLSIVIVVGFLYSWPRRGAFAIRRAGGMVWSEEDAAWADRLGRPASLNHILWMGYLRADDSLNVVDLSTSHSLTNPLSGIQSFPNLKYLTVNGRQLDQSVDDLRGEFRSLEWVTVHSAGDRQLTRLTRFPNLSFIDLNKPIAIDLGIDSLKNLGVIQIRECANLANCLKQIGRLPHVQRLHFHLCTGFSDDDLSFLIGLHSLKFLQFDECTRIGDVGLRHLSEIEGLNTLSLPMSLGEISEEGVQTLASFRRLRSLNISKSQLRPEQIKTLTERLTGRRLMVD